MTLIAHVAEAYYAYIAHKYRRYTIIHYYTLY